MSTQKFRPYFTAQELTEIISWGKKCSGSQHLIRYLETFAIKIEHGTMQAQLTLAPTIETKLGLDNTLHQLGNKKYSSYLKWLEFPASCTSNEIALAKMYRYENDLMDPEEEAEYEKANGLGM